MSGQNKVIKAKAKAATTKRFHYMDAVKAWEGAIIRNLEDLKQPLNQKNEYAINKAKTDIKALLQDMYNGTVTSLANKSIVADPTGVLTNQTTFVTNPEVKAMFPHWPYVQQLNAEIIEENAIMTTQKQTTPTKAPVNPVVETAKDPIAEAVAEIAGTVETNTPVVETNTSFNESFHVPYTNNIDMILLEMNDALDGEELKPLRIRLQDEIRKWLAAFYKSMHDLENPNRVTVDTVGILTATTKYSQPEAHETFDHAHLVDKIIAKLNEKYKDNNGCEASVHAMATALDGAQDDTKDVFSVPTDTDGTTIEVDKKTKKAVVKKDGVIVHYCKKFYEGTKKFFSNIWNGMKRFGNWIKSWFVKDKKEERIDVSPEEAKRMEEEALARVAAEKAAQPA